MFNKKHKIYEFSLFCISYPKDPKIFLNTVLRWGKFKNLLKHRKAGEQKEHHKL